MQRSERKTEIMHLTINEVEKSRHSRLSGIVVLYNGLKRDDSGQAGMTSKEGHSTSFLRVYQIRDLAFVI
jgi:hypothetical protein